MTDKIKEVPADHPDEIVSIHEISHGCVALLLGHAVALLSLEPCKDDTDKDFANAGIKILYAKNSSYASRVCTLLAGGVGVELFFGVAPYRHDYNNSSDDQRALTYARFDIRQSNPGELFVGLQAREYLDEQKDRARKLLIAQASFVRELSRELMTKRIMLADTIKPIVEKHGLPIDKKQLIQLHIKEVTNNAK